MNTPEAGTLSCLIEVLRGLPRLDGALCATDDHRELFWRCEGADPRTELSRQCQAICRRCAALKPCAEWAATQKVAVGVVGGKHRGALRWEENPRDTRKDDPKNVA